MCRRAGGPRGVPGALLTPLPHSYAYIEFEEQSSVKAAVELDESVFRGRVIKVRAGGALGAAPPIPSPGCLRLGQIPAPAAPPHPAGAAQEDQHARHQQHRPRGLPGLLPRPGRAGPLGGLLRAAPQGAREDLQVSLGVEGPQVCSRMGSLLPCLGWEDDGGGLWQEGMSGKLDCHPVPAGIGHCTPSLTSPRAVLGCGAPLALGVQPRVAVQEGMPALGRVAAAGSGALVLQEVGFVLSRGRARLLPWYFPY